MKKQFDIKKLVLLNLPYLLMGLFATNFGEAWRLAQGANASEKFLSLFAVLPGALQSFWPSLHPLDLLVGLCCGAGLRLAVYLKSKNAKKYRHGMEYGSARWGTHVDIAPYIDPVFQNNVILTKHSTNLRTTAKELDVPERRFVRFLIERRFVYRTASGNVLPYANVKNAGLFCVKDYCNHGHTGSYTLVTPQGKLYFAQLREMILLVL